MNSGKTCRNTLWLNPVPRMGYARNAFCEREPGHEEPHEAFVRVRGPPALWNEVVWRTGGKDVTANPVGEVRPVRASAPYVVEENDLVSGPEHL
jgi:hypothetical protein